MAFVIPDALELEILQEKLTPDLTLKLFSNNFVPIGTMSAASFTEVTGGGYANKPLTFANWSFLASDPSVATYNAIQEWTFTGPTTGPGTIYGYYIIRNSDGKLMGADRFSASLVPFNAVAGSKIRVLPKFSAQSLN